MFILFNQLHNACVYVYRYHRRGHIDGLDLVNCNYNSHAYQGHRSSMRAVIIDKCVLKVIKIIDPVTTIFLLALTSTSTTGVHYL